MGKAGGWPPHQWYFHKESRYIRADVRIIMSSGTETHAQPMRLQMIVKLNAVITCRFVSSIIKLVTFQMLADAFKFWALGKKAQLPNLF
jgi:hypothetical protein